MPSDVENQDRDPLATGGAIDLLADIKGAQQDVLLGRTFGEYRIMRLIAEGGMSRVYLAERTDGRFEREVAIKVSPASSFSTSLRERFLREQGMLASLTHPNIAQLYDARITSDGLPYIVMELISGSAIDDHCRNSRLNPRQIVSLVLQVTDAIAYAHARLIVHRDIKPSNILVGEDGRPKVLDFGIAKLLEPGVGMETDAAPMTPRFASPEQLLAQPITVASDVYQVGLLLLELLTGQAHFSDESLASAIRRAAEDRPIQFDPVTRRRIPRELLRIVDQCLRSQPEERYRDANAMRADLSAFLSGHPVQAAGQGLVYRMRKFAGRNTAATVISAAALTMIVGGSIWYAASLSAAREIAEQRAETANRLLQTLSSLITDTFEGFIDENAERQVGSAAAVQSALESVVNRIRTNLDTEPQARGELLRVKADIERALGDYAAASSSLEEAQQLLKVEEQPAEHMALLLEQTHIKMSLDDIEAARMLLEQAAHFDQSQDLAPEVRADYLHLYGLLRLREAEFNDAMDSFEQARQILTEQTGFDRRALAEIYLSQANLHRETANHEALLEDSRKALRIIEETESAHSSKLVGPLRTVGWAQVMLNDLDGARTSMERAMAIAVGNFGETHRMVADTHNTMGLLAYYDKRLHDAIGHVEASIRIQDALYGTNANNLRNGRGNLAMLYSDVGEMDKAGALFAERVASLDGGTPEERITLNSLLSNEARRLRAIGDYEGAARMHRDSRDIRIELFGAESTQVADAEDDIGLALYNLEQYEEAEALFRSGLEKYRLIEGEYSEAYQNQTLYEWRYDLLDGNLRSARNKLHLLMMEDVESGELDAIWPVHMFTDLAYLNMRLGDFTRARQALDWAAMGAATAPIHPAAYYADLVEAEYNLATDDRREARRFALKAIEGYEQRYPLHQARLKRARNVLQMTMSEG